MAIVSVLAMALLMASCSSGGETTRPPAPSDIPKHAEITMVPLSAICSPQDDFGVTMPLDTGLMFFTSARSGGLGPHSIFYSRSGRSGWSPPLPAVEVNNQQSNGFASISPDGNTMYFAGCDYGIGDCDLYTVNVGPRGAVPESTIPWAVPTNLGLPANSTYWDSQPCIAADGSVLYFSSDRPGGLGGKDIWVCGRNPDGSWKSPVNAGNEINTPFDEVTPWLTPDGKTLLFSSNGQPGTGGFDVFSATEVSGMTVVENLGSPINSSSDEIGFTLSADGTRAFVASNRGGGSGGYDIYQVTPVPITIDPYVVAHGVVRDADGHPLIATIELTDLTSDQRLGSFTTDLETGTYTLLLPRGFNYALTAEAPGHLFNSRQILVPVDLEQKGERTQNFTLQTIKGSIELLVFFDGNKALLKKESSGDLDRIVQLLTANPGMTIEVAGHSDNAGPEKDNLLLSQQRAQAVKSYLVGNRIKADRIKVTGYGSSMPIAGNDTEEGRAANRRVEVRILAE